MANNAHRISIIIVNYRSKNDLIRCLFDLSSLPCAHDLEVIIVNNDPDQLLIPTHSFTQHIIEVNQNIGFGCAHNYGIAFASRPYLLLLNPDTHSFSSNFLDILELLADHKTIAAPQIFNKNGSIQKWSCGNRVTPWSIIANNFGIYKRSWNTSRIRSVYWVSGAALFISRTLFQKLGGFDESFFLYYEDVDLCERLQKIGGRVLLDPHATLIHTSGGSSRKTRLFQKKCYYRSQDLFITKHFSSVHGFFLRILRVFHLS